MLSSKLEFLGVFAFVLCIALASGLKCYQCGPSTTSLADCAKSQKELDCQGSEPRCFTLTTEFKVSSQESKSYTKSCTTKAACDLADSVTLKACKDAGGKCEYKCCDTDLCNGANSPTTNPTNSGSTPIVSIILMVSCASVGFFRFV